MLPLSLSPRAIAKSSSSTKNLILRSAVPFSTRTRNFGTTGSTNMGNTNSTTSNSASILVFAGSIVVGLSGCALARTIKSSSSSTRRRTTLLQQDNGNARETDDKLTRIPNQPHTLFVWDFDWTVINCNSDEYIPAQFMDEMQLKQGFRDFYQSTNGNWHACVEGMVNQVMTTGGSVSDIGGVSPETLLDVAEQMPYLTEVRRALDDIHGRHSSNSIVEENGINTSTGTGQMILSDGNTLFIGAFLEGQNLLDHFRYGGVISNEGQWINDNDGGNNNSNNSKRRRLRVIHQSHKYGGHDCDMCSANLCKSQALQKTLAERLRLPSPQQQQQQQQQRRPRIVYIGDGANDSCPVLNVLKEGDVLLARVGNKRNFANERKGPETDEEAKMSSTDSANNKKIEKYGSPFGILPTLQKAKEVPQCQIMEWRTGKELRQHVRKLLEDVK